MELIFRPYKEEDKNFIYNSYLKSNRYNLNNVNNTDYYTIMHRRLDNFFKKDVLIIVCCDISDENIIYGYMITKIQQDKVIICYTYVKHSLRGNHICSAMIEDLIKEVKLPMFCLDKNNASSRLIEKYKIIFNPYLFEEI